MAYEITDRAAALSDDITKKPNIVFCIDDYGCFGAQITKATARWGMPGLVFGAPGLVFGGLAPITVGMDQLINLSGTTADIQQQLDPDKGAATSTQSITVKLVDLGQQMTKLISPGKGGLPEVLYKGCQVYLGHEDSSFPEDYIELFNGSIQGIRAGSGYVEMIVEHPEGEKRSQIFPKIETTLAADMNFNSGLVQDLFYQAQGDIVGSVQIQYVAGASGNTANVTAAGNLISVQINPGVTTAKVIKAAIENHSGANQLVFVSIHQGSNPTNPQALQPLTTFTSSTEIELESVDGFLDPYGDILKCYALINDELIEYSAIDIANKKLTGCSRAQLNTLGAPHFQDDSVFSFYKLGNGQNDFGNALDLILWILLSNGPQYYAMDRAVSNFVRIGGTENNPQAIYIAGENWINKYGIIEGDTIETNTAGSEPENNFSNRKITAISYDGNGTIIEIDGAALALELDTNATVNIASQFNILPEGLGLLPRQVDIARFLEIKKTYAAEIGFYELYLKDSQDAKNLINEQILLPSGMFSIPRKGRISVGKTAPPLFESQTKTLTLANVKNPDAIVLNRSVTRNFYNSVIYKYNADSLTDKMLSGFVTYSNRSLDRINAPNMPLIIKAGGLRPSGETALLIDRNSARFLNRYEFGAESFDVEVPFGIGWGTEVGDPIIFGSEDLQISDTTRGDRKFQPRIFSIVNKRMNWKTGKIVLSLLDTNYNQPVRYGVFSPTSRTGIGSTTTEIIIKNSYGTKAPKKEINKWKFYKGKQILVHDMSWTTVYKTRIQGFDAGNDYKILIDPIATAPGENWEITLTKYDDIDENDSQIYKSIHVFFTPQLNVVSSAPGSITLSPGQSAKVFIGSLIRVHSVDYSFDTGLKPISVYDIIGDTIYSYDLTTPASPGDKVDLIGFVSDNGQPYVWL